MKRKKKTRRGAERPESSGAMDFFGSRYFSINKKMLKIMGLWPYQSYLEKILIRLPVLLCLTLFSVPQILNILVYSGVDINKVLQAVAILIYMIMVCLKMVMAIATEAKFHSMYECIGQNWIMTKDEEDAKVIRRNSEFGRFLTIGYMSYMFSALSAFITMPMLPMLMDKVVPLNESRPLIFILEGEYFVDSYENYIKIYIFEVFACVVTVAVYSTIDSTYAVCVRQCIALIELVKLRLDPPEYGSKQLNIPEIRESEADHSAVIEAIQLHQKAIDFANALESTYTTAYLITICLNSIILSVGSAIILINLHRPMELFRFVLIYIGLMIHLFYLAWMGQQMIDAGEDLLSHTHSRKWYKYSVKTQKTLQFMMMRCKVPCQLTAGGICVLNIENFGSVLKTSLSYITVFASMV